MTSRSIRPAGVSAGGWALALGWCGGAAVARLTGATPVVIVLAAGVVLFSWAVFAGALALRGVALDRVLLPASSTQGDRWPIRIDVRGATGTRALIVDLRRDGETFAEGEVVDGVCSTTGTFSRRGVVDRIDGRVRSAGSLGLVWWSRPVTVTIDEHFVAPAATEGGALVERSNRRSEGERAGPAGAVAGETDGIRPWRDGDSERFVHWASSLRTGELVVHDRREHADQQWLVRARERTSDPDAEAGRVLWALEQGLRTGAVVAVAVGDGEPVAINTSLDAARWSAAVDLGSVAAPERSWFSRRREMDAETTAPASARWWTAAATIVSLAMLMGALGMGALALAAVALAIAGGAAVSARSLVSGRQPPAVVRGLVGAGALLALAMVAASSGRIDGLLSVLRGPLPQILIILIALHGFECHDRRTIRVGLAISAVVIMYASGFRVDGTIGWWLLIWAVCFGVALVHTNRRPDRPAVRAIASLTRLRPARLLSLGRPVLLGSVATVGLLAVVPVPSGPARLTLPTFVENASDVPVPGALASPDGSVSDAGDTGDGTRAPGGQVGGYPGFAQSMDTSVRGDLGDDLVMRVRAPEPDFWRGQTFSRFDGRTWYADDDVGTRRGGPNIEVPRALGDIRLPDDVEVESFTQTYFVETDLPNIIFGASRAAQVIVDADVWTRLDGALRSSVVMPAGSIYTVVSSRGRITDQILRRQGHSGERLTPFGRELLDRYLQVPDSTTDRTRALAAELAAGTSSTFEIVQAYDAWLARHVEYDLDAPVPARGVDAVDDFLFNSQLGFCEQIASALTIMLRTQGVPARVATGYLPGTRDQVAGVFEVRASDAHAWVEVWFPETGWQAFDPTASVPLSGDAELGSVGADLAGGITGFIGDHPLAVGLLVALAFVGVTAVRLGSVLMYRRRRGRWGLLQDRFDRLAADRGVHARRPNPQRAAAWTADDVELTARSIADRLDRVVFDPAWVDDDQVYREARRELDELARR